MLKLFARRHWIQKDEVEKMLDYENSGFSLDAKVKIESWDREGLDDSSGIAQGLVLQARICAGTARG